MDHVMIIGGTRGLGRVVTERLARSGANVTVVSRNPVQFAAGEQRVRHVTADLERSDCATDIIAQARLDSDPIRYLMFCQRYRGRDDVWAGELHVSLTATKDIIEALANHFCTDGDRAIGVVSSVYAQFVGDSQPVGYHVAKAGLNAMVRYYARTLGPKGIRVNAVMPLTYTKPESEHFYLSNPQLLDLYTKFVPLGRLGRVGDSADALEFLCGPKSAFISGQCLFVDGGVSIVWQEALARDFAKL